MTFIASEPDIPVEILEAQEEGRLVFFCGAGISYQLGFGDFKWLVDEICKSTGVTLTDEEQQVH
jgi:NAD-dependent SIR2 family protein deacetylase